ncbi:hypothetical protein BD414DRAFT_193296 [Trametes punicea]|nr:hypothetical protein BD414DRAFT_193296 [Trametes punicea]
MSLESAQREDGARGALEDEPKILRFVWTGEGNVKYNALPHRSRVRAPAVDPDAQWEIVGSFSVDSGMICLFSKYALDALLLTGPETDREAMLESLIDDDEGSRVFVPGGIFVSGNDGGYELEGRFDTEGKIIELRLLL